MPHVPPRLTLTSAAAVAAVCVAALSVQTSAQALPPGRPKPSRDPQVLNADGRNAAGAIVTMSPALDGVPLTSVAYDGAALQRAKDAADLADANHRFETTEAQLAGLQRDSAALGDLIDRARAREQKLTVRGGQLHDLIRSMAIQRYVNGSSADLYPNPNESVDEALQRSHEAMLAGEGEREVERDRDSVRTRLGSTRRSIDDFGAKRDHAAAEMAAAAKEHEVARADARVATAALAGAEAELRASRPMTVVTGSDLPAVALDAYWRAANDMTATRPTCGLTWWGLAGIGRSESNHGRSTGGQPGPDGHVTIPIIGVPLDGVSTRAVPDTDKGVMDLDPLWDRAVGVMQFLPGTWKRYAEDQSGDKLADPQNIYDATLAAAKLLCTHGPGLDTPEGLRRAYYAYNHSDSYVDTVLSRALAYQQLPVPGPAAATPSSDAAADDPAPR